MLEVEAQRMVQQRSISPFRNLRATADVMWMMWALATIAVAALSAMMVEAAVRRFGARQSALLSAALLLAWQSP